MRNSRGRGAWHAELISAKQSRPSRRPPDEARGAVRGELKKRRDTALKRASAASRAAASADLTQRTLEILSVVHAVPYEASASSGLLEVT